ncbi:phosphate ABC transporter substrate-binding/OmpA family protein [Hahella sp. HN01]|uniref:phosphate ABC transporter substrate-binding/OmpA family protein n=1 Tax=Hahella sp. HN01 TaxID=2847262 RepID=UPI001C1EE856|nr:phosphate ABC transporter substrate-binding/OmpA family protein [Hahella sp. HN01]MBU6950079.1 OmpA family protein [Hahella sp. HN01]
MKAHVKIVIILLLGGLLVMAGVKIFLLQSQEDRQLQTTDAKNTKGAIRLARDSWVGYFPLCSPEMNARLRRQGYLLECVDDQADYQDRFKRLSKGEYTFIVATVDSYVQNGAAVNYPGPIISVIDESKGGDAIVARQSKVAGIEDLRAANGVKVAFTPNSPSEHLLRAIRSHFDLTALNQSTSWKMPTNGSGEALDALLKGQADVAVVWEPEVTRALSNDGIVRLLGTEDTQKLIVDVLVANATVLRKDPEMVSVFLKAYYQTLQHYRRNQDELVKALRDEYDLDVKQSKELLSGVEWKSLTENAEDWFGVGRRNAGREYLVDTIESAVGILLDDKVFSRNPIPNNDPYRLLTSAPIKELYDTLATGEFAGESSSAEKARFRALAASEWERLREFGALKVRPIIFASGTSELTLEGKREVDLLMENLQHYPNFRVEIRGHTGVRGDAEANKRLSLDRAEAVYRYIEVTYEIDPNRFRFVGFGGEKPLPQLPNESLRAYNYRLPRVEIVLVSGEI